MKRLLAVSSVMCLITLLGSQAAFARSAEDRTFGQIYTDCGLGAMIAPETPGVAAVTNVTWDLGTTAVSSNVTSPGSCQGSEVTTAKMIYDTYPKLEQDLARGDGEHLDAVLAATGCPKSAHGEMTAALRSEMAATVQASDYDSQSRRDRAAAMYNGLYQQVDGAFAQACNVG